MYASPNSKTKIRLQCIEFVCVCVFVFCAFYSNRETTDKSCYETHRYAMIVHGYQETCDTFWVRELRKSKLG